MFRVEAQRCRVQGLGFQGYIGFRVSGLGLEVWGSRVFGSRHGDRRHPLHCQIAFVRSPKMVPREPRISVLDDDSKPCVRSPKPEILNPEP